MSSVMFQGTASNVGKSIIVAGICRVMTQDGYNVVPFKAQNMSLNSFIDENGLEMGRAQVFQAEACEKKPRAYMNPVLLKPCGNHISQVIVNGKSVGNMSSREYQIYKKKLIPILGSIFNRLSQKYDAVIMEGAGSPAEININSLDISNMKMAEIADSPVILVADIDKGGVFASVVGTLQLLKESERKRVKAVIINKFRGKKEYFQDGIQMLEEIIKIPVLGLIPYFNLKIDEEDGVSKKFNKKLDYYDYDFVNIEIVKLPHMSNYTDFEVFEHIEKVNVRYIDIGERIGSFDKNGRRSIPDMLIIPGSKSTVEDIKYLRDSGLYQEIKKYALEKRLLIGICGGYQILGEKIYDKSGYDGNKGIEEGFGFIKMNTVFSSVKKTVQVEGEFGKEEGYFENLQGNIIEGYELHLGQSIEKGEKINDNLDDKKEILFYQNKTKERNRQLEAIDIKRNKENIAISNKEKLQYKIVDGHILGTYCHGFFDNIKFTSGIINNIRKMKNISKIEVEDKSLEELKIEEYDKLANIIRENIDIKSLYKIIFQQK